MAELDVQIRSLAIPILGSILLLALAACQSLAPIVRGAAAAAAVTQPAASSADPNPLDANAVEAAAKAQGRDVVWGAVSNCTCHEYVGTGSVATAIDNAKIGATIQEASETGSSVYFYVTFDPKIATRERVVAAIKAGGGRIKTGPPTSIDD
jgi:hypothetical protein